jgi:hypothetical protein
VVSTANRADFPADRQPEGQEAQSWSGAKYFGRRGEAAPGRGRRLLLSARRLEPNPNSRNYNDVTHLGEHLYCSAPGREPGGVGLAGSGPAVAA